MVHRRDSDFKKNTDNFWANVNYEKYKIRYSLVDEDEAISIAAEQDPYDTSIEELSYYDKLNAEPDAVGEMSKDADFVERLCREKPSLARSIINAIKSVLRKLRQALSSGAVSEEYRDAFFSQINMWDEAQRLWMKAAKAAQKENANRLLDERQEGNDKKKAVSYKSLVSKKPIKIVRVKAKSGISKDHAVLEGLNNIKNVANLNRRFGMQVYVKDVNKTVVIGKKALTHSLNRNSEHVKQVIRYAGDYLKNSIVINYIKPTHAEAVGGYILLSYGESETGEPMPVYFVVDTLQTGVDEVIEFNRAYSMNGRKIGDAAIAGLTFQGHSSPTINIDELLEIVKMSHADILSDDVLEHFGMKRMTTTSLSDAVMYSLDESNNEQEAADLKYSVADGKARWTDERIDSLIKEYGASSENYSQAYAVMMNPRDYLKLTLSDEMLDKWNEDAEKDEKIKTYQLDEEKLKATTQTPYLTIYSNDGTQVQGHEGRYRMRTLKTGFCM